MLAGIWFAVFLGQIVRVLSSFFYVRRLKREARLVDDDERAHFDALLASCGVRRRARLLLSPRIASPVAVDGVPGVFKFAPLQSDAFRAGHELAPSGDGARKKRF